MALVPDDPRPWTEIPAAILTGVALGLAVLWIAIRYMIKKK
jgi:hypothetical protein